MRHLWKLMLISFLNCYNFHFVQASSVWISQGTSRSFQCEAIKDQFTNIQWDLVRNPSQLVTLFLCSDSETPRCESVTSDARYQANLTAISTSYTSVLTLINVTLEFENRILQCKNYKGIIYENYNLNVFVPPDTPTCDNITVTNNVLQIRCSTQKVSYGAICMLYLNTNSTHFDFMKDVVITYENQPALNTNYTKTECTYTISGNTIGPGKHEFRIVMYANISSNITDDMKRESKDTYSILITYPKAVLAPDCQLTDYIKENETITCTCYDDNPSFLPTQLRWSTDESSNSTLIFTARRPSSNVFQMFKCTIINSLNWTDTITYQPSVAYPPTLNLSLLNTNMDICDEKETYILGNCYLTPSFPQPSVQVYINNVLVVINPQINSHVYTFNCTVTSAGIVNVTCYANNKAFSVHVSKSIFIKGPPEVPKMFKLIKDESSSFSENPRQAIIMCQSRGGYPYSKRLSLTCGSVEVQATNNDNVLLYLNMTNSPTDVNCTCFVLHDSKCLQNKTNENIKLYFRDDSSLDQVNKSAIGLGVTLAIVIILFICTIFLIIRRNKRTNGDQQNMSTADKRQDYNNIQATTQYVNTEMHAYETANTRNPSFSNEEFPTTSLHHDDKPETKKEEHPYDEVTDLK